MHACIHTYRYARRTLAHPPNHAHEGRMYIHTHKYTYTYTYISIHTYADCGRNRRPRAQPRAGTSYIYIYIYTHIHTYIHILIHAYMNAQVEEETAAHVPSHVLEDARTAIVSGIRLAQEACNTESGSATPEGLRLRNMYGLNSAGTQTSPGFLMVTRACVCMLTCVCV